MDSTRKLKELPGPFQLRRPIYVVCNDTMVENPIIASYVDQVLEQIEKKAREEDLPILSGRLHLDWKIHFG